MPKFIVAHDRDVEVVRFINLAFVKEIVVQEDIMADEGDDDTHVAIALVPRLHEDTEYVLYRGPLTNCTHYVANLLRQKENEDHDG